MASHCLLYRLLFSVVWFSAVNVCDVLSLPSSFSNTTITAGPLSATKISGVIWIVQPVSITITDDAIEVETFYAGGGASGYTTFTLTGPTTFVTYYTDGNDVGCTYYPGTTTLSIPDGVTKTETLLVGVNGQSTTGSDLSSLPWQTETTFVLTGPTVFVTQAYNGTCSAVSPPYMLQSAAALQVTTISPRTSPTTVAATPIPTPTTLQETSKAAFSSPTTATVFIPRPASAIEVSSSPSTQTPTGIVSSPTPQTLSRSGERFSSTTNVAINMQSQPTTANAPSSPTSLASFVTLTESAQVVGPMPTPLVTPITLSSSAVIIEGQTLTQGQVSTTISGIAISLVSDSVYLNGQGTPLPAVPQPAVTIDGQTGSLLNPSAFVIGSQTAVLGSSAITVSETPIALNSGGLVVGTSTIPIAAMPTGFTSPPTTRAPYITIGTETIALGSSAIVVHGTTISPGAAGIIVDGTLISLGTNAFVVGSKTEAFSRLPSANPTGSLDIAGAILSGIGQLGGPIITSTLTATATITGAGNHTTVTTFAGAASGRLEPRTWQIATGVGISVGLALIRLT